MSSTHLLSSALPDCWFSEKAGILPPCKFYATNDQQYKNTPSCFTQKAKPKQLLNKMLWFRRSETEEPRTTWSNLVKFWDSYMLIPVAQERAREFAGQVLMHGQKHDSRKMHQRHLNRIDINIFSSYTFSIPLLQTIRKNFLLFPFDFYIFKGWDQHTGTACTAVSTTSLN